MEKVSSEKNASIVVEAIIQAEEKKVWEYWTGAEHIRQWCAASDDWHVLYADNNPETGGHFKTTMAAKDGSYSFDFEGVYSLVKPYQLLAYQMADGRNVSVEFTQQPDGIRIVETFEPESTNPVEMQRGGWQEILNNFKKYAESH